MKKLFFFLLFLIICFTSCDGRDRVYKTNTENLEESKLSVSFFNHNIYIPQNYIETVTDTILSSNLRVKIKYYSLSDKNISIKSIDSNNKKITKHYHQFESQITVFKRDKLLFATVLNISDFIKTDDLDFWNKAILQFVWLDEFKSNDELIQINCSFLVPNTKAYKSYKIYFNAVGEQKIELIESS